MQQSFLEKRLVSLEKTLSDAALRSFPPTIGISTSSPTLPVVTSNSSPLNNEFRTMVASSNAAFMHLSQPHMSTGHGALQSSHYRLGNQIPQATNYTSGIFSTTSQNINCLMQHMPNTIENLYPQQQNTIGGSRTNIDMGFRQPLTNQVGSPHTNISKPQSTQVLNTCKIRPFNQHGAYRQVTIMGIFTTTYEGTIYYTRTSVFSGV